MTKAPPARNGTLSARLQTGKALAKRAAAGVRLPGGTRMAFANPAKLAQRNCLSMELQMLISPSPINTSKQLAAVMRKQRSMLSMAQPSRKSHWTEILRRRFGDRLYQKIVFGISSSGEAADPSGKQRGAGGHDTSKGAALAQDQPTRGDRVAGLCLALRLRSFHFGKESVHRLSHHRYCCPD
jgi:hypothetical protein